VGESVQPLLVRVALSYLEAPIVDLGPGRCAFTRQDSNKIVAFDNAPGVVDQYKLEGLDIRLGTAYELPLEDASVSGVFPVGYSSTWMTN
jgi:hypothetical protein